MKTFFLSRMPAVWIGAGMFTGLGGMISRYGKTALVLTGGMSLEVSGKKSALAEDLADKGVKAHFAQVAGEPSPELVDSLVHEYRGNTIDVVVSVGGGSVIDTGKAVSAMLPSGEPVFPYLEGVGAGKVHDGRKVPFIAVPTTAGTGSEATKNAVLGSVAGRFKKSLRHDNFVPDIAVIDPELMLSCPPSVTASCGMDALCQLLESYVSTQANPATDALALSGLEYIAANLLSVCSDSAGNIDARAGMAYSAYLSGITLANAGLGVVHGFASSIGGMFPVPHGVVCGTLLAESTAVTIERLRDSGHEGIGYLKKYARAGGIIAAKRHLPVDEACGELVATLRKWKETLKMPRLGDYGVRNGDIETIVAATGCKNNPVRLSPEDLTSILEARI